MHCTGVNHISDENLERYYLGTLANSADRMPSKSICSRVKSHDRHIATESYVDTLRIALRRMIDSRSDMTPV